MRTELERQQDLLSTGRGAEAVRAWGGRSRASMLADPAGLGRFRWFVVTTPGVAEPTWLRAARALGEQRLGPAHAPRPEPAQRPPRRSRSIARYCSHTIDAVSTNMSTVAAEA